MLHVECTLISNHNCRNLLSKVFLTSWQGLDRHNVPFHCIQYQKYLQTLSDGPDYSQQTLTTPTTMCGAASRIG